jgi:hypothetical protein
VGSSFPKAEEQLILWQKRNLIGRNRT